MMSNYKGLPPSLLESNIDQAKIRHQVLKKRPQNIQQVKV